MKKITLTLSAAAMLCAVNANAETYFFSPEGAGDQDGTNWENAAPGEYLGSTIAGLQEGDEVYMMAGNYRPDINMGYWNIPTNGVKICGGYPASMTGTDTAMPAWGDYSVWDADIDGDGKADNGGKPFVYVGCGYEYVNDRDNIADPGASECKQLPLILLSGIKICNADGTGQYKGAAMIISRANVELGHVAIENCRMTETKGGIIVIQGGKSYIHDFTMRNCESFGAGMGIQYRQYDGNSAAANTHLGGTHILERAEFTDVDSRLNPDKGNKDGANYGGTLALSDGGGELYMVNCSISGSHIWVAGGGIRVGGNASFYNIHNTWYDCTTDYTGRAQGKILSIGTAGKFYTANSVVVNKAADELNGKDLFNFGMIQIQTNTCTFATGGYNVLGSTSNNTETPFASTDKVGENNTIESVFGSNARTEIDGYNVRLPQESFAGTPLSDITKLKSEWNLPECLDLAVDIRGNKRADITYPGAYDPKAGATQSITDINKVEEEETVLGIYDMTGRAVSSNAAPGLYIIRTNLGARKVLVK